MKNLSDLMNTQTQQQQLWHDWANLTPAERVALNKDLLLNLHEEVAELQRRVNTDRFHILRSPGAPDPREVAHDGVDVFKYLLALMALNGVDAGLLQEQFDLVTATVEDRWRGENLRLSEEVSVLLIDLDGCAADWTKGFRAFAQARGIAIPQGGLNDITLEPLKDAFDNSGGYLALDPIPGAVPALKELGRRLKLVAVTARPYQRCRRVYADTMMWFNRVGLRYDHIIFTRDKAEAVRKMAPARVLGFVEDRAKHAIEVALTGVRVFKMPHEGLEQANHPNIIPVSGWDDILAALEA